MKLLESMTIEESHATLDGLGREGVGLYLTLERKLSSIGAPGISWRMDTAAAGFFSALAGKRRDVLVIEHAQFREYAVLIAAREHGTVLHVAWLLVVTPRLLNDLRRAVQIDTEPGVRFEIGAELRALELLDLKAFVGITKLGLKYAIRQLTDEEPNDEALFANATDVE